MGFPFGRMSWLLEFFSGDVLHMSVLQGRRGPYSSDVTNAAWGERGLINVMAWLAAYFRLVYTFYEG